MPTGENSKPLPTGCRGSFACIAEYLEWEASDSPFTRFKAAKPSERVYFIGSKDGPVKIGVTTNPVQRLEYLRTGSPSRLELLATVPAGRSLERAYHRYFEGRRLEGEWFDRCKDLEDEIFYWSRKARAHGRFAPASHQRTGE